MKIKSTEWKKKLFLIYSAIFLFLVIASAIRLNSRCEYCIYDLFMSFKPQKQPVEDIMYLKVEEEVKEDGFWPWGKDWLAYLVNFLSGLGVKAIGIDPTLAESAQQVSHQYMFKSAASKTPVFWADVSNYPDLALDRNNRVRSANLVFKRDNIYYPSLVLNMAMAYLGLSERDFSVKGRQIHIGHDREISIPLSEKDSSLILYNREFASRIEEYSYFDVAFSAFLASRKENPAVDFAKFKDKVCLIGLSIPSKVKSSNMSKSVYSPSYIRLNMLENIISSNFIRSSGRLFNFLLLLVSVIISVLVFIRFNLLRRIAILAGIFIFYILVSYFMFSFVGLWIDTFLPLVAILVTFFGITVYRYGEELEVRLEERRRELARRLKAETLTRNSFSNEGFELIVKKNSTGEAEGDFHDTLELDNGRCSVIIGNAPGKNLKTVNYLIKTLNEFRLQAPLHKRPRAILNAVNNTIFPEGSEAMYATCIYFEIDTSQGLLSFSSAGEEPFMLARSADSGLEIYGAGNPTPLGVAKNVLFSDQVIEFNKGDLIVAFTKGIAELKNKNGEEFGIERIKEAVSQYRSWDISKLANKVFEKIHRFSEGQDVHHECTLLLMRAKTDFKISG
ncbi:MAG: SpoIIE family protein phosphatase [Candidatus Omnitrophica bacterium]|nr:SpoIIE family protein phosphatase [Candidatus Omnitrophota bacterium]